MTDPYVKDFIMQKEKSSSTMNAICAQTLGFCNDVQILRPGVNGIAVLRQPAGVYVAVHSAGGDPSLRDMKAYTASMVDRLVAQARAIGARPLAFADVLDANNDTPELVELVAKALVESARKHGLAIMNGETARLGPRINCEANLTGTMISVSENELPLGSFLPADTVYGVFRSDGRAIYINSDGVGTKTEFYERLKTAVLDPDAEERGVDDCFAMLLDDLSKVGGTAKVGALLAEVKGYINLDAIARRAARLGEEMSFVGIVQREHVGRRLRGYTDDSATYNLSGSVVSVIDEKWLEHPLKPSAGEYLVGMRRRPTSRSNGISDLRKAMVQWMGPCWHTDPLAMPFLEYVAEPSTILYPAFKELIESELATSVYHNSGGAWEKKLAKPLAEHGLFIRIENMFPPDERHLELAKRLGTLPEDMYKKWPMGTEGSFTTRDPEAAMKVLQKYGIEGIVMGRLEKATGVVLAGKGSDGKDIYFSGRD